MYRCVGEDKRLLILAPPNDGNTCSDTLVLTASLSVSRATRVRTEVKQPNSLADLLSSPVIRYPTFGVCGGSYVGEWVLTVLEINCRCSLVRGQVRASHQDCCHGDSE